MADDKERLQKSYSELSGHEPQVARALELGYEADDLAALPPEALLTFGCGNPVGIAGLRPGEKVADLGCGGGLDALLAARRVGPQGGVLGVDANAQMLARARASADRAGVTNLGLVRAELQALPLGTATVDVALSNCALNHGAALVEVFAEVRRVLKPGGRLVATDLTLEKAVPDDVLEALDPQWADWLRLAVDRRSYVRAMREGGFTTVDLLGAAAYESPTMDERLRGALLSVYVRAR